MLEAIRTSQEGIADELSGNTVAELIKKGTFGGFNEERIQLLLEVTWNNIGYDLKYKRIAAGQLEECSDSKVMQSLLNVRTFQYHFGGGRFHMLPQSYKFSQGLFLDTFLQVLFIGNQRYQVTLFVYINRSG